MKNNTDGILEKNLDGGKEDGSKININDVAIVAVLFSIINTIIIVFSIIILISSLLLICILIVETFSLSYSLLYHHYHYHFCHHFIIFFSLGQVEKSFFFYEIDFVSTIFIWI